MNSNSLYFNIYYCNGGQTDVYAPASGRISKTGRHHKLILITGGNGKIMIGDKKYKITKGTLVYYPPVLQEDIKVSIEEPVTYLSVLFDYVSVALEDGKYSVADAAAASALQLVQNLTDFYPAEIIFEKMVRTWKAKLPGYEFISKTLLQEFLIAIFQNRNRQSPNYAASLKTEKVIQYMREHIDCRINLKELAELVQISTFRLSKIFKEITGYSVIDYFNKIKIDQAKALLLEGDRKIKGVAQLLGFSDEFYFSRLFKRIEGRSPRAYLEGVQEGKSIL